MIHHYELLSYISGYFEDSYDECDKSGFLNQCWESKYEMYESQSVKLWRIWMKFVDSLSENSYYSP